MSKESIIGIILFVGGCAFLIISGILFVLIYNDYKNFKKHLKETDESKKQTSKMLGREGKIRLLDNLTFTGMEKNGTYNSNFYKSELNYLIELIREDLKND